jgi:hypothetical protein
MSLNYFRKKEMAREFISFADRQISGIAERI